MHTLWGHLDRGRDRSVWRTWLPTTFQQEEPSASPCVRFLTSILLNRSLSAAEPQNRWPCF